MENNNFKNVHKPAEGWWKITPNQLESKVTIMCNKISELLSIQIQLASQKKSSFVYLISIALRVELTAWAGGPQID